MDVLVVPSIWPETFGMIVYEAVSFGIPVIMTDRVGAIDLFGSEKKDCCMIIRDEYDQLYELIMNLIIDRSNLIKINKAIMKSVFNFDFERHVERMIEMYRNCKNILQ